MNEINKLIKSNIDATEKMKRVGAKVVEIISNAKAKVQLQNNAKQEVTLLNKTGEILTVGDFVWIHYWGTITSGYIAIRNGEANNAGGGGGFYIENAVVMTEEQSPTYTTQQEIINIDVNNLKKVSHTAIGNPFVCDGNIVIWDVTQAYPYISSKITVNGYYNNNLVPKELRGILSEISKVPTNDSHPFGYSYTFRIRSTDITTGESKEPYIRSDADYSSNLNEFIPTDYGLVLIAKSLTAPNNTYPYGRIVATPTLCVYDGTELKLVYTAEIWGTNGTNTSIYFASEAEYNYAIGVTGYSEIQPSNAGNV